LPARSGQVSQTDTAGAMASHRRDWHRRALQPPCRADI